MRRAVAPACALLLVIGAAPAVAQDDPGARTPAIGGGSFNAAPLLEPGRYRDTILPREFLYYGVALQVGQRLHVRARIASTDADTWTATAGGFVINLSTPLRQQLTDPVAEDVLGNGNDDIGPVSEENMGGRLRWDFYGPPAQPLLEALEQSDFDGPGTWYVSFNLLGTRTQRVAEFPVEFELEVDGTAQTEAPDPTPEPTATPTPGDEPAADDDGGGGAPLGAAAALGAVGLAAGLVLGGALVRRRRP